MRLEPLEGKRFGKLLVVSLAKRAGTRALNVGRSRWNVICDCGVEKEVIGESMVTGVQISCGCVRKERARAGTTKHGLVAGGKWHPLYSRWLNMKGRCYNENNAKFRIYGARGIRVCERWLNDFAAFVADVGLPPSKSLSIDRIDNNGNYEPGNVRWATPKQQRANQRRVGYTPAV